VLAVRPDLVYGAKDYLVANLIKGNK